jgi:hypothetical protein
MFGSGILGVAIGLVLLYFLLSLVCSGINEVVEAFLRRRAKYLEGAVIDLVGRDLKRQLYDHALLEGLYPQKGRPTTDDVVPVDEKRRKPSYIPSSTFAEALASVLIDGSARLTERIDGTTVTVPVDATTGFRAGHTIQIHHERMEIAEVVENSLTVARSVGGSAPAPHAAGAKVTRYRDRPAEKADLLADLRSSIAELRSGTLRESIGGLLTSAESNLDRWRKEIEAWFDKKMLRVSGWYGRRTRSWLFVYGILVVLVLNADTALFARTLWGDATLRDAIVVQAEAVVAGGGTQEPCEDPSCVVERLNAVQALRLPLGWPDLRVGDWGSGEPYADDERVPHDWAEGILKIFGLLLTAAALALGAPFWFDVLNKVTNVRASGRPPSSTQA